MVSSAKLVVCGRGKPNYQTDETKAPEKNDLNYSTSIMDNSIVMACLINPRGTKISQTCLFLSTAKAIWDMVKRNYSDLGNATQIFKLKSRIKEMKQGTMDVTQYCNDLQAIWQELDLFYESELDYEEYSMKQKKIIKKERVFKFLAGLNKELNKARRRVLRREPFPSADEVF